MGGNWSAYLSEEGLTLANSLAQRARREREGGELLYPPQEQIFRALTLTPPRAVRAVILGQDPYHGPGQANGLAFSVNPGVKLPPSLRNIFRELEDDLGCPPPASGDLTAWARRGVLLLNTCLTVREGRPCSCADWGWQDFVQEVYRVCARLPQPVVFLLWGAHARAFAQGGDGLSEHKAVLQSSHPSPLGARKASGGVPAFLGSRPFSGANRLLREMGGEEIDWSLT